MDWKHFSPNVIVSRVVTGDPRIATKYFGEANKLLFELINQMKMGDLGRLNSAPRSFSDGTVIRVYGNFGHYRVEIDVSGVSKISGPHQCIITFVDLPTIVAPMDDPHVIATGEIAGTDYYKTYYTLNVTNCKTCAYFQVAISYDYAVPVEEEHYYDDPENH